MFTDQPVTPVRLEILMDVLHNFENGLKREEIHELLQPNTLSGGDNNTTTQTISASLQLGLTEELRKLIKLSNTYDVEETSKNNILKSIDDYVLGSSGVEPHLALFYAYILGLNSEIYKRSKFTRENWANTFNKDVFTDEKQSNPFNATKKTGLERWFSYIGLGWYDSKDEFQVNPYKRLVRALPDIFAEKNELKGDRFMEILSETCPELDGGEIFFQANRYREYRVGDKQCTLGLSHALVDLHLDGVIRLDCPIDSRGWNIELASPPRDDSILSDRITIIYYLGTS